MNAAIASRFTLCSGRNVPSGKPVVIPRAASHMISS